MNSNTTSQWWAKSMAVVRILFGVVWAIDAWYKWQPAFLMNMPHYLSRHIQGQLPIAQVWMKMWVAIVDINPHLFGYLVALGETAVALALILGLFCNLTYVVGAILSFIIWSTAEGFGGPYHAGATDIGTSVMYVFIFASLYLAATSRYIGIDRSLATKMGRFGFLTAIPGKALVPASEEDVPQEVEPSYTHA
ncbi:MAG TPA: hypothetical protein VL461_05505 [Dictyobacter sp.]|jgi:uncharacterized membrane protein YphA (DoxX/SURF4 family)|nr:hypothetical protein [Dictyobacter sp.]